jgi:hypothetical protein
MGSVDDYESFFWDDDDMPQVVVTSPLEDFSSTLDSGYRYYEGKYIRADSNTLQIPGLQQIPLQRSKTGYHIIENPAVGFFNETKEEFGKTDSSNENLIRSGLFHKNTLFAFSVSTITGY